jgi:hypothetical protein
LQSSPAEEVHWKKGWAGSQGNSEEVVVVVVVVVYFSLHP